MATKSKKSAKTSARRAPKSKAWAYRTGLSETQKIVAPKENPFREETERHTVFEKIRKAGTVGKFLAMSSKKDDEGRGRRRAILRSLVHEGVVKLAGKAAA